MSRRTETSAERVENDAIRETLKVSNYLEDVFEAIHTGTAPKVNVPNFHEPTRGEAIAAAQSNAPMPHESGGMRMSLDDMFKTAASTIDPDSMPDSMSESSTETYTAPSPVLIPSLPRNKISKNQWSAIQKYPTLIDFLGQPGGEQIAKVAHEQVTAIIAEIVNTNSKEANEFATICESNRQNIKQYFQSEDWVCRVTASGPFRGDEAIYYSREKDVACVLRKHASDDDDDKDKDIKYEDISSQFNIIYEAVTGNIPSEEVKVDVESS